MKPGFMGRLEKSGTKGIKYPARFAVKLLMAALLLLFVPAGAADSKELRVRRSAGEYQVEATVDRSPLVLGDNHVEIEIRDRTGKSIVDAEVLVNYYMPPMPRMVPMNYRTEADLDGEKYEAKMDIIMAGPWYIKIIIKHEGKISTTKFNLDAQ